MSKLLYIRNPSGVMVGYKTRRTEHSRLWITTLSIRGPKGEYQFGESFWLPRRPSITVLIGLAAATEGAYERFKWEQGREL